MRQVERQPREPVAVGLDGVPPSSCSCAKRRRPSQHESGCPNFGGSSGDGYPAFVERELAVRESRRLGSAIAIPPTDVSSRGTNLEEFPMERQMRLSFDKRDEEEELWQQRRHLYRRIPERSREETIRVLARLIARAAQRTSPSKEEEPSREDQ
jgi:hypothetical protein